MNRVIAVVEGQTEQGFVRDVLAPWLGNRGVYLTSRLVGKTGHKGGVGAYQRSRRDILLLLKQEAGSTVTTMFDFFGMPNSWPGRSEAARIRDNFLTPEEINDGPNTAPSKRLLSSFNQYRKRLHGSIAAKRIGIEIMKAECPHFEEWLSKLEALAHDVDE